MIEHEHLRHLAAFARYGTLLKAAEELHISQPTLTRSMQKLEDEIGVPLFLRTKNHLEFNANGELAADYARRILEQTDSMVERVRALDRAGRTISIGSCAPMPMLTAVRNATHLYPEMTISSECRDCEPLIEGLRSELYQIIILPYRPEDKDLHIQETETETLFFAVPSGHRFAGSNGIYMKEMDGENMLLYSDIGFWHSLPRKKMPHSRFLVQTDRFAFEELMSSSILPCFVSDMALADNWNSADRVLVPILDPEAKVTYHMVCLKKTLSKVRKLFLSVI